MVDRRSARTTKSGRLFGSSSQPGGEGRETAGGEGGEKGDELTYVGMWHASMLKYTCMCIQQLK